MKTILKNILKAVGVICYFLVLAFATTRMEIARLANDIEIFSGVFLVLGLIAMEIAYKKDSGMIAITAIELLVISFYSLSIKHMTNLFEYDFKNALIISAIVAGIYYVVKGIILYTKERKELLNNLSDISEIVKKDEPVKKEAKKREKKQEEPKEKKNKAPAKEEKQKAEKKEETTKKKKTTKKTTSKTKSKKEVKEND